MTDTTYLAALADRLEAANRWRRGDEGQQPDPTALGVDIDAAVAAMRQVAELREALQEADTLMGHDDAHTEWRERWQRLWEWHGNVNGRGERNPGAC